MTDSISPRFEELGPLLVAGISQRYTDASMSTIPALWQKFVPYLGRIPGQVGGETYGLIIPGTEQGKFDYACGVEVSDVANLPGELRTFAVPRAKYAVFTHEGYVSALPNTFGLIWNRWLPESKMRITKSPQVERYGAAFRPDNPGGIEIWIPLQQ